MDYLVIIIVLVMVGVMAAGVGVAIFSRKTIILPWLKGSGGLVLVCLSLLLVNFAINMIEVRVVKVSKVVAKIKFTKVAPQVYKAQVSDFSQNNRTHLLKGELWQVDIHLFDWPVGGVQDGYRLAQLRGRYLSLDQEAQIERTPNLLRRESKGFDLWQVAYDCPYLPIVSAKLEQSHFIPMADNAEYTIGFVPKKGLSIKPLNDEADAVFEAVD